MESVRKIISKEKKNSKKKFKEKIFLKERFQKTFSRN